MGKNAFNLDAELNQLDILLRTKLSPSYVLEESQLLPDFLYDKANNKYLLCHTYRGVVSRFGKKKVFSVKIDLDLAPKIDIIKCAAESIKSAFDNKEVKDGNDIM